MSTQGRFVDGSEQGAGAEAPARTKRWLVALDIDGTTMREDGVITQAVVAAVRNAEAAGHEVMLSTGRSEGMTVPLLETLGIRPKYLVCANGALVLARRADWLLRARTRRAVRSVRGAADHPRCARERRVRRRGRDRSLPAVRQLPRRHDDRRG
ncbi:HAD hydrolase family protein [Curtobacterium flaccumfaciens]|nr:HAD hydrolase family protein [Curtobacterium flaccumfaciens]